MINKLRNYLKLQLKFFLWPGFNWVSRDKSKLVNLFLEGQAQKPIRTLDIGCGNAFFSYQASLRNSYCLGITIHEWESARCNDMREYLSIPTSQLEFRATSIQKLSQDTDLQESFDQVIMLDVLEHIRDDRGTLQKIYHLLNDNGFVFIAVPSRDFEYSAEQPHVTRVEDGWHVRHGYTFEQLEQLLESQGFEPIDRRSYGTKAIFVIKWLQDKLNNNLLLMFLFFPIFKIISWILFPWKHTHTILVIARKKAKGELN